MLVGGGVDAVQGLADPGGDDGVFDEGIGGDDVDWFLAIAGGEGGDRVPDQLQDGGAVFAAAVTDDPGYGVELVECLDFGGEGIHYDLGL